MPFPVDEKIIRQTEEKLSVVFPDSFKAKMMQDNGGEVKAVGDVWRLYPFYDSSGKKRLKRTCNDIVRETGSAKDWRGFPQDAIAIACDDYGNLLLFLRSEEDPSRLDSLVFLWNHETGEIEPVASDFSELL